MHTDLVDTVQWAVRQGYVDPKRVAVMGGSYGGYASLASATFTPDLFRCAVPIVAPSNLFTLLRSIPSY
jgi:dipeptidyl aminopeptidase/acylaminoacyl peptidase